jgi:hypothetical protein
VVGNVGLYYVCYQLSKRGWRQSSSERICGTQDVIEQREGRFNLEVM